MKKRGKRNKNNPVLLLLSIISSLFLIYHILLLGPIEKTIRYILIIIIIFVNILLFAPRKKRKKNLNIIIVLFIILNVILCYSVNKVYSIIDSINKNKIVYSSSLITLANNKISTIDDVTNLKIGLIDDNLSIDNYIIAKEIIDEEKLENDNNIINYSDLLVMLKDLYNGKIDLMFVSSNYNVMFQDIEGFENISNDVKVILEKDKTIKKENTNNSFLTKNSNIKPFAILLMGVDSEKDGLKQNGYANGDGLMLLTVNPETLNITMMSIPRDSYVPITCRNNVKNKLTHAGWFGTECMVNTIENIFDINIYYYVKVNFKGVVGLVNALGGVEVDVPNKLCTNDSNRDKDICINKGLQTLDGEGALVLARNRYNVKNDDIGRGYNQQLLIRAIINKMTEVKDVNQVLNILETVSNNLDTNLTTEEILSFYNLFKDILLSRKYQSNNDFINIFQIRLDGDSSKIYFDMYNSNLWIYELDKNSVKNASNEMKINLGINEVNMIKKFEFRP